MLAKLSRELPVGDGLTYEPKWDGFRCLAFREGDHVELSSRNERPFARYFPEIVDAVRALAADHVVLDGELLVHTSAGFDFAALMKRLHPARSRVEVLRTEYPACYVLFDIVEEAPFGSRRAHLESLLRDPPAGLALTPSTADPVEAAQWLQRATAPAGIDGVVVKPLDLAYMPGRRAMTKVKLEATVDCVVAGFRWYADQPVVGSLLLGLHDDGGSLRHVGVAGPFTATRRRELVDELLPLITDLDGHPWQFGFGLEPSPMGRLRGAAGRWTPDLELDWIPLRPALVAEVAYDQLDAFRFRNPARFRRWRPDRDPRSCTLEQLG
jgi:ATP-dependent DNA ligase